MAIFNSLGSNYSKGFVLKSLFGLGSISSVKTVREHLAAQYGGSVTLTYKGRQALELAFRRSGLPAGSKVGISGFTCYVVYGAIVNAGYKPVFIDVAKDSLHFGVGELEKHEGLKAIVVQNTLGLPADMPGLHAFARKHKIMIVEDLAHSMGAVYEDGLEAGTVGDMTMLSFSQDKPLDVVAGGALIDRRAERHNQANLLFVSHWQRIKNRWYPFWTLLIRNLYRLGLGKYLHFVLKKLHLLATPMSDDLVGLHDMSPLAASLLKSRLGKQADELVHRRTIAGIYAKELPKSVQYPIEGEPSYLRFPLHVKDRDELIEYLKQAEIYIGDTWYDAPIAPKRYLERTDYQAGECPRAEKVAATIVNLPTHIHVSEETARAICAKINQWLTDKAGA